MANTVIVNPNYELPELHDCKQVPVTVAQLSAEPANPDLILDFSAVNYIDTNGVRMIQQIIEDFSKIGVTVYICEAQGKKIYS